MIINFAYVLIYETIKLTNNSRGFGSTTRVDAFNFPMGLKLTSNGYH